MIYIKDLVKNPSSNPKPFAHDHSLFSIVSDLNTSTNEINDDLKTTEACAHQWKLSFNPDSLKQAQEDVLSQKRSNSIILVLFSTLIR